MTQRRTWRRIHLTQLRTPKAPALAGFCVWYSTKGEQIHPTVSGLATSKPEIDGWRLLIPKRSKELRHAGYFPTVDDAKRAARKGRR